MHVPKFKPYKNSNPGHEDYPEWCWNMLQAKKVWFDDDMTLLKGYALGKKNAYEVKRDNPQAFVDAWNDFCETAEGADIAERINSYLTERSCFGGNTQFGAVVSGEWDGDPLFAGLLSACNMLGVIPEEASRRLLHNPDDWQSRRKATHRLILVAC